MVSVKRTVHDGGSHLQHQMSAPRRPAHLLPRIHSPVQQPLHRALVDRRRDRFFTPSSCRVVDYDIRLSGHVCLQIAQKPGPRLRMVHCGIHSHDGFGDEIQRTPDLTMPETPTDPFDRLGEASTGLTICLRRIGTAHGRLCDVLNAHREMEPVEHVMSWPRAGCFRRGSAIRQLADTVTTLYDSARRCAMFQPNTGAPVREASCTMQTKGANVRRSAIAYPMSPA